MSDSCRGKCVNGPLAGKFLMHCDAFYAMAGGGYVYNGYYHYWWWIPKRAGVMCHDYRGR